MASNSSDFVDGLHYFGPSSSKYFDFSALFEDSILSILPSSLLLLLIPFRLWTLHREPPKVLKSARLLYTSKLTWLLLLTVVQTAILILYAINSRIRTPTTLTAAVLVVTDALGLSILSHAEHFRSIRPSNLINAYLFITLLFDIARTRTLWIQHAPLPVAGVFTSMVAVKFMIAITEAIEKRNILLSRYQNVSPEATSGIYSRAFFWWLNNIMLIGFRRVIHEGDLFLVEEKLSSAVLKRRAEKLWDRANKNSSNALFWLTLNANSGRLLLGILPRLCLVAFRYSQPFLLSRTVEFVGSKQDSDNIGWGLTGAFFFVFLGTAISNAAYGHMCYRFVTAVRGTLVSMVYSKTVDLSITVLDESAAITLMSNDTETICNSFQNLHEFWSVPIEFGIALWLLQRQIGLSFLAPAAVAILSIGGTVWVSQYIGDAQRIWNEGIQTRVDVSASMLGSMKTVKILGFTPKITEIVQGLRVKELRLSAVFRRLLTASAFFSNNMRLLAPVITFIFFVLFEKSMGREVNVSNAFTTLSLISMINVGTLLRLIPSFKASLACFDRIQSFLESDSRQLHVLPLKCVPDATNPILSDDAVLSTNNSKNSPDLEMEHFKSTNQSLTATVMDVRNASFGWSCSGAPQVNDVSFCVPRGSFIFIIGPVGCGKSTLLKGLMSETPYIKGFVYGNSLESAFADQTPWIQNTTIRQNIVGVSSYNSSWYEEVVKACALDHDIALLPDLHESVVGSQGISLSGGQKQRVALARTLYPKKELVVIDDCFSGLDAETEESVFVKFFGRQGLLRESGSTAILVTHAVHRLAFADHIIAINADGQIAEQGTFEELKSSGGYVANLATKHKHENTTEIPNVVVRKSFVRKAGMSAGAARARAKARMEEDDVSRPVGELSTYKYYFASVGWSRTFLSLFYTVFSGVATKVTELVITYWTNALEGGDKNVNTLYLGLYSMLGGIGTIFWTVACYHFFLYLVPGSAEKLHARLLGAVMNAPLCFFTSTDTGVTTNRFSQDMSVVDVELPFALIDLIVALVQAVMGAILMCFMVGYFSLTLPPIAFVVWLIQKYYLRTSRQIRLLDLEARAPLYSHFIESLSGLVTIRAFGWSDDFVEQNLALLDNSQKPYYLLYCIQRWLALVLDLMVTALAVILMILVVKLRDSVGSGYVGLAILNVIGFSQSLAWIIRQWTSLETSIGAVARLKAFNLTTPDENLPGENQQIPDNWPAHGVIEVKNLYASYNIGSQPVLRSIDMSIRPGERIGICGRTGSGKSSLVMSLFRLLEISSESSILIDGIDITKVSRQTVRSRLNAIPQEPFFLKGSIRLNMSPDIIHSDTEIIATLTKVELWPIVESKGGLDAQLELEFFSHGQRQLFCLGRAILRKSKIVILDEVSSSIDVANDKLVQRLIRDEFKDFTIISIAHRLDTILDFDRIALLNDGDLVEFDSPRLLLQKPSAFRELYNS